MKQLRFEWLKLRKQKLHILVLLCLLIIPIFVVKKGYDQNISSFFDFHTMLDENSRMVETRYVIDEDVRYEGFEAIVHKDEIDHALAGNESNEWHVRKQQIVDEKIATIQQIKAIDEDKMKQHYGKNWNDVYDKLKNNTLTYREFRNALGERFAGGQIVDDDHIMRADQMKLYYSDDYEIKEESITAIYGASINNENWKLYEKERFLITKEKLLDLAEYREQRTPTKKPMIAYPELFMELPVDSGDEEIAYLNTLFLKQSTFMDGNGAYTFFLHNVEALKQYLPWILLLFGILLSSIFNLEYSHKTDQSLRAMTYGNAVQAKTKLKLSFILVFGFSLYTLCLVLLVPQLMIGYHSLQIRGNYLWDAGYEMVLVCIFFIMAMLFYYGVLMLLSSYAKSKFIALIFFAFVVVLTCYGGNIAAFINSEWLYINTVLPGGYFVAPYNSELCSYFGFIFERCYLLMVIFGGAGIVMLFLAYQHYRRRDIVNA